MQTPQFIPAFSLKINSFPTSEYVLKNGEMRILYQFFGESEVIANNNIYRLSTGDVFILTFPDVFEIHLDENSKIYTLSLENLFFTENQITLAEYNYEKKISDFHISQVFNELIDEYTSKKSFSLHFSYHIAVTLLVYLTRFYSSKKNTFILNNSNPIAVDRINTVIKYIEDNYNRNISINELASLSYISENYLIHEFKKVTRLSINQVINIIRLRHSNELLYNPKLSISDISEACGFNNYSYFYTSYKKAYGISPSEYRKQLTTIK